MAKIRTISQLAEALEERVARRREIRRLRDQEQMSLRDIGLRLGISGEMVRQIIEADPGWEEDPDAS